MTDKELTDAIAAAVKPINDKLILLETRANAAPPAPVAASAAADPNAALARAVSEAITKEIKPFADKLTLFETNTLKASARAAVQPHIARGAIAPQDNDTIAFWENSWIANAKGAEAQLARLPGVTHRRLTVATARDAGADPAGLQPEDRLLTKAATALKDNQKLTPADALIAAARSPQGQEDYMAFRATFASKANPGN